MPIIIDTTVPYLCQCKKNEIEVNKGGRLSQYNPVFSELEISLINISEDSKFINDKSMKADDVNEMILKGQKVNVSCIVLQVRWGNSTDSFTDNDSTVMFTEIPGWTASSWRSNDDSLTCTILKKESLANIEKFESIEIAIKKICSYSQVGMTYIKVRFCNINGVDEMVKIIPIKKVQAKLQINQFVPLNNKYVITENEEVRLHWKTGAATGGKIHPVEYIIDSKVSECIDKPNHSKEYIIDVTDGVVNMTQMCPVFVSPPIVCEFAAIENEEYLKWSTKYSTEVFINGQKADLKNDKYQADEGDRAVLTAKGYLYNIEKTIFFTRSYEELSLLSKNILEFKNYCVIQLWWKSSYSSVKLNIFNPEECSVTLRNEGNYEYAVEDLSEIRIEFVGVKSDGSDCLIDLGPSG